MTIRVATTLGRYEIESEIGRGAMGIVYRALDPKIDRIVAIKTISMFGQEPDDEQSFRERFFQEARAAGRLCHPGIVTIFDVGEDAETHEPFIVMEYVQGQPLSRILAVNDRKLPLGPALHLAQEIAEALQYAHTHGVVHRDIKPANILVTEDGRCKITDFGIAQLNQAGLTAPGRTVGSPAYMAPEQLSGEGCDARSDLFSLGVILYTILTGHRPFQGNSAATVMFKVVNSDPIAVSAFDSELPPEIDRVVSKAIAKDPAERFQSGREMAVVIQELREHYDLIHETATALANVAASNVKKNQLHLASPTLSEISFANSRFGMTTFDVGATLEAAKGGTSPSKQGKKGQTFNATNHMAWVGVIGILLASTCSVWLFFHQRLPRPANAPVLIVHRSAPAAPNLDELIFAKTTPAPSGGLSRRARTPHNAAKAVASSDPAEKITKSPVALSNLQLEIEHPFPSAEANIWLDNVLIYTRRLHAENKKHAILFKTAKAEESDTLVAPAGEHRLHVRVQSSDKDFDQSKTVAANLLAGAHNVLHIMCDTHANQIQVTFR
ncbi:MAG: hypothetical protein NVS9B5_26640 [Terriglobales bacterium]